MEASKCKDFIFHCTTAYQSNCQNLKKLQKWVHFPQLHCKQNLANLRAWKTCMKRCKKSQFFKWALASQHVPLYFFQIWNLVKCGWSSSIVVDHCSSWVINNVKSYGNEIPRRQFYMKAVLLCKLNPGAEKSTLQGLISRCVFFHGHSSDVIVSK